MSVELWYLLVVGLVTGIVSGMFGLGGGLVAIPMLTFIGIPPGFAVTTATNQMTAGTVSSCLAYAYKDRIDYKLAVYMMFGGFVGNFFGLKILFYFKEIGQSDFAITILFLALLIGVAISTIGDAVKVYQKPQEVQPRGLIHRVMPFHSTFNSIEDAISLLLPIIVGFIGGIFVTLLGVGGGFIMVPLMIYYLRVSIEFATGTTLFQIIFTSILSTYLHAFALDAVDLVLSLILMVATALGGQVGAKIGMSFSPNRFRVLLAILLFGLCVRMFLDAVTQPAELFFIDSRLG